MNSFFKTKILNLKAGLKKPPEPYIEQLKRKANTFEQLSFMEITAEKLDLYIQELKNSGANGSDTIPAFVMKDAHQIWHKEILHLLNLSLCTGIFPDCLKITKILPSVKRGKPANLPSSYRPISSLNMLAKILERAGFDQLQQHCDRNQIICEDQHGGRAKHSTTTCLIETQECIQEAKDKKLKSALMAIDLSAAYDLCSHDVLDQQLRLCGTDQHARGWILSFLGNRTQFVEVEGTRSTSSQALGMGLCQGGRSSGILFAIHTNQLPSSAKTCSPAKSPRANQHKVSIKQFVDDTNAIISAKSTKQLGKMIQMTYNLLEKHLTLLGMAINGDKTQLMLINPDLESTQVELKAGGISITHQHTLKVLGYTFSEDLKTDEYIWRGKDNLLSSIRKKVSMLRVLKPYMEKGILTNTANMLINSQITYLAPLWNLASRGNKNKVQTAQIKAARQLTWTKGAHNVQKSHRQDLLTSLGWMNIDQILNQATIQLVKKAATNQSSAAINRMFNMHDGTTKRPKYKCLIFTADTKKRNAHNILDIGKAAFNQLAPEL